MIEAAALIIALAFFSVAQAFSMWWFARSLTALAAGALNLKQVAAADGAITQTDPVPTVGPDAPEEDAKINTRTRLSRLSDADLAAAIQDVKVVTMDENNGIEGDVEPIKHGGRGVYAR